MPVSLLLALLVFHANTSYAAPPASASPAASAQTSNTPSSGPQTFLDAARALHTARGNERLWLDAAGRPTSQAKAALAVFEAAGDHGLDAQAYGADRLRSILDGEGDGTAAQERFDLAMTVATMRYAQHLHGGRVNPRRLGFEFDAAPNRLDLAAVVQDIATSSDPAAALEQLEPNFFVYQRLQAQLPHYRALAAEFAGNTLPAPTERVLEPGSDYAGTAELTRLLVQLGDLPGANGAATPASTRYEGALVSGVRQFQRRHGLDVDGRIGPGTLAALNTPMQHRVEQLSLAMERLRWVPPLGGRATIVVNIPEFRLRVFDEERQVVLGMKVVVGRATKSRTPVFAGDLATVVFRPYWNVPRSIEREMGGRVGKDFERVNGGLRQKPGSKNALGLVKFLFPNDHAVYLHDTPSKGGFASSQRDFSHGCIRLEDPAALAAWVLGDDPAWTAAKIDAVMHGDRDNIAVSKVPPVPVYIFYVTAVVDEAGEVAFFEDVYGHDAALAKSLRAQAVAPASTADAVL